MFRSEKISDNSDSLIDLLVSQCSDLEKLLALAREESAAAEQGDFEKVMRVVTDRERIGSRLETFQRQISDFRGKLRESGNETQRNLLTTQLIAIANLTIEQDLYTKMLLSEFRERSTEKLRSLDRGSANVNTYLREETKGLAYDKSI